MKKLALFLLLCTSSLHAQISDFIHVDQFGYPTSAEKVAVLSDPIVGYNASDSYTPDATIELRNAATDAVVYSAAPSSWQSGNTHGQSGDRGWWFNFSSVTTPGTYYVYDVANDERSAEFDIDDDVYLPILKAAGRMYFYNRCGQAKSAPYAEANWVDGASFAQDANCRYVYDPNNASLERDMSGGWFDAGDYNKYVTFAEGALHDLLWAYQENPEAFDDDWNIPESGNGVPDLIDEIKWELDWLMKMVNTDGSVHIKMGSISFDDNEAAPPSANTDTRYYGPTCTSAAIAIAGIFSHAAIVFDQFPSLASYANTLETKAEDSWSHVLPSLNSNTLEENCDDGSVLAGDADWTAALQRENAVKAAIYLYTLTNTASYNQYVINNINDTDPVGSDVWDNYEISTIDALLLYTTLSGADNTVKNSIIDGLTTAVNNNYNGYFGFNTTNDLYRAFMPDWSYHWGSNSPKAGFGNLNKVLINYGINTGQHASFEQRAAEQIHYFHGVNPQGLVYLSNMYSLNGDRCINEIYHTWFHDGTDWDNALTSLYGPAPGYVTGGPNSNYNANTGLTPPYNQPLMKSYLDWNDDWPNNSWEITEPAIYYQAAFVRLLANYTEAVGALAVDYTSFGVAAENCQSNRLHWTTENEVDNHYFAIERKTTSSGWETIARVYPQADGQYEYVDTHQARQSYYYRIAQIDFDGSRHLTDVKVSEMPPACGSTYLLSPNPSVGQLLISGDFSKGQQLKVYNSLGMPVATLQNNRYNNFIDIRLADPIPGVYLSVISDRNGQVLSSQKIVVR